MQKPACVRAIYFFSLLLYCSLVGAQYMRTPTPPPRPLSIPQSEPRTGTNLKGRLAAAELPADKRYSELTQEQKDKFKAHYQDMADEDEPPFPIDGLGSLYKPIIEALNSLRLEGSLDMEVEVDSTGKAKSVSVRKSPGAEITKVAAAALMFHTYKPALCRGKPCTMVFPLSLDFIPR